MGANAKPTNRRPGSLPVASFPLKVACVDMGSNAIRFIAAEFRGDKDHEVLLAERRPVRLGHGVFLTGKLVEGAMDAAVQALGDFAARMEELGVEHYRAVATSAVREAKNGAAFVARVAEETGLELELISGSEEARLVHLAVVNRINLHDEQWILVDLGGGSVEVSLVDANGILWSESHTMGSVRLLEELAGSAQEPGRFQRLLGEYIATLKIPSAANQAAPAGFAATGGNIESLAKLAGEHLPSGVSELTLARLRSMIGTLARLSYHERVEQLHLREDRADVILPAAMVFERLAELCGADKITVPHVGIKEGVLYDLVDRLTQHRRQEASQARVVQAGALTLGRRYFFDEPHALHVASLALSLFDQLQALHGLGGGARKILQAAALLHDVGQYVSYKRHHKHTLYLLRYSELPNFSPAEMALVAAVARYHRKSEPADHHFVWDRLSAEAQDEVRRLAAILRVADAMDREHLQRVKSVSAEVTPHEVIIHPRGSGELLLEGWSITKKGQMFSSVYDRKVRVKAD